MLIFVHAMYVFILLIYSYLMQSNYCSRLLF